MAATVLTGAPAAGADVPTDLGKLRAGHGVVTTGPWYERTVEFWETCDVRANCREYTVDVVADGDLRALLDPIDNTDQWGVRLRAPSGAVFDSLEFDPVTELDTADIQTNDFTQEVLVRDAERGRWLILVVPVNVDRSTYRLRVQLDRPATPADEPELPNLKVVPPNDFGFVAPAYPLRPPDPVGYTVSPPSVEAGAVHPMSCTATETAETASVRCLRFSTGLANAGDGPLDLRFDRHAASGVMSQHVRGDASTYPGPPYAYHPEHLHFHNLDLVVTELFAVSGTPERPVLVPTGSRRKSGFCLLNNYVFDMHANRSDSKRSAASTCDIVPTDGTDPTAEGRMVLIRGWVDTYRWYTVGQYLDFAGQPDGTYLLRSTADVNGHLRETDETDNTSYAYVDVRGDDVDIIERGFGASPWDPDRKVIPPSLWPR